MFGFFGAIASALSSGLAGLRAGAKGAPVATVLAELDGDDHAAVIAADERISKPLPATTTPPIGVTLDRSRRLAPGQFINEVTPKQAIGLHFTAGASADSCIRTFANDPRRVATAYVVDTDGTVFELFDPKKWAYSFGVKGVHSSTIEKRTVAIEIANWGPLVLRGDSLYAWPPTDERGRETYKRLYCKLADVDRYVKHDFRGVQYFAAYPEPQIVAVIALVEHLCREFNIPGEIPGPDRLWVNDVPYFAKWRGIFGHQNVREKVDPGPAFPWARLAKSLKN